MAISMEKKTEGAAPEASEGKPEAAPAPVPRPQFTPAPASRGSTMLGVCLLLASLILVAALAFGFGAMKLLFVKPF